MTIKELIKNYKSKISKKDKVISRIKEMIQEAKVSDTNADIEDLTFEKENAQNDRKLYAQFVRDLEHLDFMQELDRIESETDYDVLSFDAFNIDVMDRTGDDGETVTLDIYRKSTDEIINKIKSL